MANLHARACDAILPFEGSNVNMSLEISSFWMKYYLVRRSFMNFYTFWDI
jgi:hypothetical protein